MSDDYLRHMPMIEKAFEPVHEYMSTTPPTEAAWGNKQFKPYYSPRVLALGGVRMRLDYELSSESFNGKLSFPLSSPEDEKLADHISRLMIIQLTNDLADLVENGDADSEDPMLKAFDGALKRGVNPKSIVIDEACYFRYYARKKDCYEYTAFVTIFIDWAEEPA